MLSKKTTKAISGILAATLVTMSAPCVLADGSTTDTGVITPSQGGVQTPSQPKSEETQNKVAINISANYEKTSDEKYKVDFSSLDVMTGYKDFCFTVSVTDATISDPSFADVMKSGSYSATKVGESTVNFVSGSAETIISGKLALCSILTNTLPTEGKISFTDFSAKDADGNPVEFEPTLTLKEGPVVPRLTETEQAAYDLVANLPDASTLSFYKDSALIDVSALKSTIDGTVTAYNSLSSAEKKNVDEVLTYNGVSKDGLTTLPAIVTAMGSVYDVLVFARELSAVEDNDVINYSFMLDAYNEVKSGFSSENIPADSKLMDEYTAAVTSIEAFETKLGEKLSSADYSDKIDSVSKQLEIIKKSTSDKYYSKYLDVLLKSAENLKKDMEDNCTDKYKDYMLTELSEKIATVKATINNIGDLPTIKVGDVVQARLYTITVSRKSKADADASVDISVYKKSDLENPIATSEKNTFDAKSTSVSITMNALLSTYPADENIVIKATYTINGATYDLESCTAFCNKKTGSTGSSVISRPSDSTSSSSSKPSSNSSSNGTIYPDVDDVEDNDKDNDVSDEETKELFSDISAYSWAKDAIEGLYYAGIVNGMEDGVFNPAGNVTREQFCKMVVQLFGVLEYDSVSNFTDVDENAWYAPYINSAVKSGYVQGQGGWFGVGESIMRQDMAIILYRALGSKGKAAELSFNDNSDIAEYAVDAISEFVGLGILNGYEDGSFRPRGTATRAEAAKIIWGVYQILNK